MEMNVQMMESLCLWKYSDQIQGITNQDELRQGNFKDMGKDKFVVIRS